MPTIASPRTSKARAVAAPMKPATPVTRTAMAAGIEWTQAARQALSFAGHQRRVDAGASNVGKSARNRAEPNFGGHAAVNAVSMQDFAPAKRVIARAASVRPLTLAICGAAFALAANTAVVAQLLARMAVA